MLGGWAVGQVMMSPLGHLAPDWVHARKEAVWRVLGCSGCLLCLRLCNGRHKG